MANRESFENGLLSVRFSGESLSNSGVSIYDLSSTLLALQRITHKAYLAQNGRLSKGSYPTRAERESLALQLGERRRQSDAFALIPILSDPAVQEQLRHTVNWVIDALIGYYLRDLLGTIERQGDEQKKFFIGSIHAEVVNINSRVGAAGGVEAVSIGSPSSDRPTVASFNEETREYLNSLQAQTFLGTYQSIVGRVYKFYPASQIVSIRRELNRVSAGTVSVFLNQSNFETIRYHRETNPKYRFRGWPMYRIGIETQTISEFQGESIEYIA